MNRIPTLDGWRAIAIGMVVLHHFQASYFSGRPFHGWMWLVTGKHGVGIFFVLSGYLITTRLFHESSLKAFYIRRAFRLWPVAWVYLGILLILGLAYSSEVVPCLFFYRNFVMPHAEYGLTQHFWSLSIEEQFYLVWPTILLFTRKALWIAVLGILILSPFLGAWPYLFLLVGCVLAFVIDRHREAVRRVALPLFLGGGSGVSQLCRDFSL